MIFSEMLFISYCEYLLIPISFIVLLNFMQSYVENAEINSTNVNITEMNFWRSQKVATFPTLQS